MWECHELQVSPRSSNRRHSRNYPLGAGAAIVEKARQPVSIDSAQKPFADEYSKVVRSVELAERQGGKQSRVNQQMRWDAGIRCARLLIDEGLARRSHPTGCDSGSLQKTRLESLALDPIRASRSKSCFSSIHYIDSLRYLLGDPAMFSPAEAGRPAKPRSRNQDPDRVGVQVRPRKY